MFHHGWPLSADDWDAQMMFFLQHGYRVIAHDRRGHGRSTPDRATATTWTPTPPTSPQSSSTSTCATPSTSATRPAAARSPATSPATADGPRRQGGADRRRAAAHGEDRRQSRAACRSRCSTASAQALAANRAQFYLDVAAGPFYGFNRPGAKVSQGVIDNWWRQGMMGGVKAHYDVHQGLLGDRLHRGPEDDRRSDAGDARRRRPDRADRGLGPLSVKLLKNGTLKIYPGFPHGMCTTHADVINPDLLEFIRS